MPKIQQLSPHIANLIAAGEVVERPASVVKELLENAVDAGATQVTVEIRDGGMTFLRVTDNGCGMAPEDARTAFLRHATSKLRTEEDLAAISTMGFRGEALAAIASVSRIDLMTKIAGALMGTSLHLEAGIVTEQSEAGCPDGTTVIIRDLFFNTPARMKFMKSDTVEGGKVSAAVQLQALAHPEVSFRYLRDGKEVLSTPGTGGLEAAVYSVYGRECGKMIRVDSAWEGYRLTGFISRPSDARPSRNLQTFFVNDRPVRSKLLIAALEEAYRNQIMAGKFPACVLHLKLAANLVDVNVHPAKTEVKFLNEKAVFDCVHYGVLGGLNKTQDRPEIRFAGPRTPSEPQPQPKVQPQAQPLAQTAPSAVTRRNGDFFRTMSPEEFKAYSTFLRDSPRPKPQAAADTVRALERRAAEIREPVILPTATPLNKAIPTGDIPKLEAQTEASKPPVPAVPAPEPAPEEEPEQTVLPMPEIPQWRMVGELYNAYIIVEQGEEAWLIDKHAAHERILFEKLKANPQRISGQTLLSPIPCRLSPDCAALLLANRSLLEELGFEVEEFGESTLLLRQIPMDLAPEDAADAIETVGTDLMNGRRESPDTVRDEILHTVACKAAIKAGWQSDEQELLVLVRQVMEREDLKHCPHGRPICVTLSKKQLEKQFRRS